MRRQTQTKHKERRAKEHRRLSAMQIAVFVIGAIVFLCAAGFGGYLLYEEAQYQKALRNYPVAYVDFIAQYAEKYELDPYLVQSIMRCESSNDPNAVSHAGAIGLMQIMPDTGEWIGHKIDPELAYSLDMLNDPATNIEYGCWYLRFLSGRFDGAWMEIIAAYNAGHGSVEDWLSDPRFSDAGVLTVIPFEETARYYGKVLAAYDNYTTLYPDLFAKSAQTAYVVGE
ncbi:MAG: lytic transglycosylase domain-containing protein [Eubacteriales bacterium]|nr:lytic transglycosylase domain-containing protein [Eubacteriales bacterium]